MTVVQGWEVQDLVRKLGENLRFIILAWQEKQKSNHVLEEGHMAKKGVEVPNSPSIHLLQQPV